MSLADRFAAIDHRIGLADGLLTYDFRRMLALAPGEGGVAPARLEAISERLAAAEAAIGALRREGRVRGHDEPVLFPRLCRIGPEGPNTEEVLARIERWAAERRGVVDLAVSIGIGGSYLGNRLVHEALRGLHWNDRTDGERGGWPRLHFCGHHLDPVEVGDLVDHIDSLAARSDGELTVELIVISKSGTTTETLATAARLQEALEATGCIAVELTAVTGPGSALAAQAEARGSPVFSVPEGIGGRWSVLSESGLLTAALAGIDIRALLDGARRVDDALIAAGGDLARNAALLYAALHHLAHEQGRSGAVLMPYAWRLKALSEWYVQLLAESLGKARDRAGHEVHTGRTPIAAVGTTDMHAQTQLHQEGPLDKTVTTVDVAAWGAADVPLGPAARHLAGRRLGELNTAARESNEEALFGAGRPSDALVMGALDPVSLGAIIYFLMMTVAYEGELLDVDAFDQPGVDAYKAIMREKLRATPPGAGPA